MKKVDASSINHQILATGVARKTWLVFYPKTHFQPIFYPKHPRNLLNQYMAFKKAKKTTQNSKST
jgi:hypothetical protein